jgi:phage tail sheath protein FI
MPEYLSPGVYVEEIQSGNKPIEGVGTSTAGLVGVTERGPVNVPQLVTSFPEYMRTFGGLLPIDEFTDSGRSHCYLPHAVEGFFTNGGKRAYVTRVLPEEGASFATRDMFYADPTVVAPANSVLLRAAVQGSGTTVAPPLLYVLDPTNFANPEFIRIGDGSRAEYREVMSVGANARHVALEFPVRAGHAAGVAIHAQAPTPEPALAPPLYKLVHAAMGGDTQILLDTGDIAGLAALLPAATPPANWRLLQVGAAAVAEFAFATLAQQMGATQILLTLAKPLELDYIAGTAVTVIENLVGTNDTLALPANAGDALVFIPTAPVPAAFTNIANVIVLEPGTANQEAALVGVLSSLPLVTGTSRALPTGTLIRRVTAVDDDRTVTGIPVANRVITLNDVSHLDIGITLTFTNGVNTQADIVDAIDPVASTVTLRNNLPWPPTGTVTLPAKSLTDNAGAGAIAVALNDRLGLQAGDVVRLGSDELATIRSITGDRGPAPDPGTIILTEPLAEAHASGTAVRRETVALDATRQPVFTILPSPARATSVLVTNGTNFVAGDVLEITLPDGSELFERLSGNAANANPREIEVDAPLALSHPSGATVVQREELFLVRALDAGSWGNRLLVASGDEPVGLVNNTNVLAANPPPGPGLYSSIQLASITGAEPGSILEMLDPSGVPIPGLTLLKVRHVDRTTRLLLLDKPGLTAAHMTAVSNAAMSGQFVRVRSREFSLTVLLKQRPDPTTPSRDDNLLDQEAFRNLSMDPRHSRYFQLIVGATWTAGSDTDDNTPPLPLRRSDRRSEGASAYIRVRDLSDPNLIQAIRLGPEVLVDIQPSGLTRPARLPLDHGDDNVPAMDDAMYIGVDGNEPVQRTGLYALKNLQDVALVAVPGQTTAAVQQSVIDHCELLLYRFAVLDGPPPADDTLVDVQNQRQQFDTHYAALYHPWYTIPDPFPASPALIRQFPVPPSGYVLGVYARVDDDRGVHKAPANEVVRGITGLTRYFTKGEQDIVNPYPININLTRDFRPNFRGLRIWGARCITSDPDRKYLNVNRLLIFLEDSIDRGLQWVVFEPNAEDLWRQVRRSVVNFLTTVWRNGALEGTSPDQGFFVRCDRTTMTRDDLDNGRLVCIIGVAPVRPAEFVIIRIGLWTADAQ